MLPYIHGFSYKWCFYNLSHIAAVFDEKLKDS